MRHDKLQRELDLILLLTENRTYTVEELCERLHISRRNLYYYFDFLRFSDFRFERRGRYYHIDRSSPFFKKLFDLLDFTEDEAIYLRRLLDASDERVPQVRTIRQKLERFYDFKILENEELRERHVNNITVFYEAIKFQQMVKICGYRSQNSQSTSDRIVEPFALMNHNNEVRCYELETETCKTFKLSRMERAELIDLRWNYANRHQMLNTDIFMFSAEETTDIELIMGELSATILCEEYSAASQYITPIDNHRYHLLLPVCSFLGIGRFVLGLIDDIEVVGTDDFRQYLKDKIDKQHLAFQ